MGEIPWRLAVLIVALIVTGCLTGAGIYEQLVLDTAWPHKPSIVRPIEGGADRKLLLALLASWCVASARYATLVAVGLFAVVDLVTVAYFGPAVLRVEKSFPPP